MSCISVTYITILSSAPLDIRIAVLSYFGFKIWFQVLSMNFHHGQQGEIYMFLMCVKQSDRLEVLNSKPSKW